MVIGKKPQNCPARLYRPDGIATGLFVKKTVQEQEAENKMAWARLRQKHEF